LAFKQSVSRLNGRFSFDVPRAQACCVMGRSGTGKTSLSLVEYQSKEFEKT